MRLIVDIIFLLDRDIREQHHRQSLPERDHERERDPLCDRERDRGLPRGAVGGNWEREWPQDRERHQIAGGTFYHNHYSSIMPQHFMLYESIHICFIYPVLLHTFLVSGDMDALPVQSQHPYRRHESPSVSIKPKTSLGNTISKEQNLKRPLRDEISEQNPRPEDAKKRCSGPSVELRDSLVDEDDLSEISDDADEILNREDVSKIKGNI